MNNLSPVCLFTYNRYYETKKTIEALKNNYLASCSDLIIFSDGAKNDINTIKVLKIRKYLKTITGFKTIKIIESNENKGLANSIITGVTTVIKERKKVIVLEDDLITSPNFLNFMNDALDFYEFNSKIYSISGYSMNLKSLKKLEKDYYLGHRASSWGWGTWLNRWEPIDWQVKDYHKFNLNLISQWRFMRGGSDLPYMLRKQMNNKIDSWAIRWCYHQFKNNLLTVFASTSKVITIGIGSEATHTKKTNRFETDLDQVNKKTFIFDKEIFIDKKLQKQFRKKFSIINRLKNKFR